MEVACVQAFQDLSSIDVVRFLSIWNMAWNCKRKRSLRLGLWTQVILCMKLLMKFFLRLKLGILMLRLFQKRIYIKLLRKLLMKNLECTKIIFFQVHQSLLCWRKGLKKLCMSQLIILLISWKIASLSYMAMRLSLMKRLSLSQWK